MNFNLQFMPSKSVKKRLTSFQNFIFWKNILSNKHILRKKFIPKKQNTKKSIRINVAFLETFLSITEK